MRIDEHNLDSLRRIIRDLQQENESLKDLLKQNHIAYARLRRDVRRRRDGRSGTVRKQRTVPCLLIEFFEGCMKMFVSGSIAGAL